MNRHQNKQINRANEWLVLFLSFCTILPLTARSIHRPKKPLKPFIITRWLGEKKNSYKLCNSCLEEAPLFKTFDKRFFYNNQLPNSPIPYRYTPQKTVPGVHLKKLINHLIDEVNQGKKAFSHFTVLRKSNFNTKKRSGLLIVKCKQYPFVVKLFMETPETFVMHNSKGIVPSAFFYMSGGINRHLLGFTRIKNMHQIQKKLNSSPEWLQQVTLPRKWFYLPKKAQWIEILGNNIGSKEKQQTVIPATYCVISDWIDGEKKTSLFCRKQRKKCMKLCNYLDLAIDPHIDNFLVEKKTGKLAIVDTEHFLALLGIKEKKKFRGYFSWYSHLTSKLIKEMFFQSKSSRKKKNPFLI